MGESFAYKGAMGQGLEHLLSNVEAGSINWSEVYECLKTPLWYAAARGARQVGVRDREAIAEAVQQAFTEFMALDFAKVASPDSIARTIAYRRGLDRGIAARRQWKKEAAMETLPADLLRAEPGQAPGYAESAEEEYFSVEELRRQEERWRRARDCSRRRLCPSHRQGLEAARRKDCDLSKLKLYRALSSRLTVSIPGS